MSIDGFGATPELASRVSGLGGAQPPKDASYVFRTAPMRTKLGRAKFNIRFRDLEASCGTLVLQLLAIANYPGAQPVSMRTLVIPMEGLAKGKWDLPFDVITRRNMLYALSGNIHNETDAVAAGLEITLDQSNADTPEPEFAGIAAPAEPPVSPKGQLWSAARLLALDRPNLIHPVCQGWTAEQTADAPFAHWMKVLGRSPEPTAPNWSAAFVLQALHSYGVLRPGAKGMGLGVAGQDLPAVFAALGCTVLAAAKHDDALPDQDPGLALEGLIRPDICQTGQFFQRVHFTTVNMVAIPPSLKGFDFIWSGTIGESSKTVREFQAFVEGVMRHLRPGGMAVHMFQRAAVTGMIRDGHLALGRPDSERIALSAISRGYEVAQLKFGYGLGAQPTDPSGTPFGLIVRRR